MQGLTKLVPRLSEMSREKVEGFVNKAMQKMSVSHLDCLQLHWWDYADKRYLDAIGHLSDIQKDGKISKSLKVIRQIYLFQSSNILL